MLCQHVDKLRFWFFVSVVARVSFIIVRRLSGIPSQKGWTHGTFWERLERRVQLLLQMLIFVTHWKNTSIQSQRTFCESSLFLVRVSSNLKRNSTRKTTLEITFSSDVLPLKNRFLDNSGQKGPNNLNFGKSARSPCTPPFHLLVVEECFCASSFLWKTTCHNWRSERISGIL